MKLIGSPLQHTLFDVDEPHVAYQLQDRQIVKQMAEPIEITHQAFNLLFLKAYESVTQLELPAEDLEYIRSNEVAVNLNFSFQFEWWNANEYQVMRHPQIIQSLKSSEVIKNPSQVVMRLSWPSSYIKPDRPFAHAISFSYTPEFNLILKQQLNTDLTDSEIKAIANESQGAPQNYRIRLTNLRLSYPVPPIFYKLQAEFLEIPNFYARHNQMQWWNEFNEIFLKSDFLVVDNFDNFFVRPDLEALEPSFIDQIPHSESEYLHLNLSYKDYNYLKIYQYFFPLPKMRIVYHQYLDLTVEFDQTTLILEPSQDYWIAFKHQHIEWLWWLNHHVEATIKENVLILKAKNHNLVRGEAKVEIIEKKSSLSELALHTNFEYLQIADPNELMLEIFNLFKRQNLTLFADENFKNYQILETKNEQQFVLKALATAKYVGVLNLNFKEIKTIQKYPLPLQKNSKAKFYWPVWNWILLAFSIISMLILFLLKFLKSKPTKN